MRCCRYKIAVSTQVNGRSTLVLLENNLLFIWHKCQRGHVIMNYPSLLLLLSVVLCVLSPPKHTSDDKSFISCTKKCLRSSSVQMVKLRKFTFGTQVRQYLGHTQRKNYWLLFWEFMIHVLHILKSQLLCSLRCIWQWFYSAGCIPMSYLLVKDAKWAQDPINYFLNHLCTAWN